MIKDHIFSYEGKTYKFVAREQKWYVRAVNKKYNTLHNGWTWQSLSMERVPEAVKKSK